MYSFDYRAGVRQDIKNLKTVFQSPLLYEQNILLLFGLFSHLANDSSSPRTKGDRDAFVDLAVMSDPRLGLVSLPFLHFRLVAVLHFLQKTTTPAFRQQPQNQEIQAVYLWAMRSKKIIATVLKKQATQVLVKGGSKRLVQFDKCVDEVLDLLPPKPSASAFKSTTKHMETAPYTGGCIELGRVGRDLAESNVVGSLVKKSTLANLLYKELRCKTSHRNSLGLGIAGVNAFSSDNRPFYAGETLGLKNADQLTPSHPNLFFPIRYLLILLWGCARVATHAGSNADEV